MVNIQSNIGGIDENLSISTALLEHLNKGEGVSVSLKYYNSKCECFSKWQAKELKALSGLIEKMRNMSADDVKKQNHSHKGGPKKARFSRPNTISPDIMMYGIKVDKKLRIHGFFCDPVFFLVWLDRKHECFK